MSEPTLQDCINYMRSQIKQMEKHPRNYEFNLPYYRKTVELLEKAERPHGEWIPCSERLPEKDGKYLVTMKGYESKKLMVTTSIFANSTKEFYPNCIAWMPLPEPYKDGGEKNEQND